MPAVKKVDYDSFCIDWENSVKKIYEYRALIARRIKPKIPKESRTRDFEHSKRWWNNVSSSINGIYHAEAGFLESLKEWVDEQYEDNELTSTILKMCHEIVITTDSEAHNAKDFLCNPVMRRLPSLKWGRPHLRDVVRSHWALHDEIKKNLSLPKYIREGYDLFSLRRALESLEWIWGIVICYARDDSEDLNRLLDILKPKFESNHINIFYDDYIRIGQDWENKLNYEFSMRDLALVLVSQLTLDSKFIQKEEVGLLCKRRLADNMGVVICPIILEECNWQKHDWLKTTQFLPSDNKTVRQHYNSKDAFSELGMEIAGKIHHNMKMLSDPEQVPEFLGQYEGRL